jgi:hypothetical protein
MPMIVTALLFAAAPLQDAPAAAAKDPVTCVNRLKTGSRVNFEQICHTRAEWLQIRGENRAVIERSQQQQNRNDPIQNRGDSQHR